jgi:hypothetical protein
MSNEVLKLIQEKISAALQGSFDDALVYGRGYIRISLDLQRDIKVEHVPFAEMEKETESIAQIRKYFA